MPAVTSAYISPCVLDMLPPVVDLVFLEFTFNDAERSSSLNMDDPTRCTAVSCTLLAGLALWVWSASCQAS